jgi:Uma2 family endonuclease
MGLPKLKTKIGVEEYLEGEKDGKFRHEYIDGEVYQMAGASDRHHRISANIFIKLDSHLDNSECEPFMTDMKFKVDETTFYYPDVFVTCEENPESPFYREKPILIIEVLSPSTRQTDKREKLHVYQQIPTVQEYVIIEQDKIKLELHRRQPDGRWITYYYDQSDRDETIEFQSVGLKLNLDEIYRRVKFED